MGVAPLLATAVFLGCTLGGNASDDKRKPQAVMKYQGNARKMFADTVTVSVDLLNPRKVGVTHFLSQDGSRLASKYSADTPTKAHDYRYRMTILIEDQKGEIIAPVFPVEREVMDDDGKFTTVKQWSSVTTSASTLMGTVNTGFPIGPGIRKYILVLISFSEVTGDRVYEFSPLVFKKTKQLKIPDFLSLEKVGKAKKSALIKRVVRAAEKEEKELYRSGVQ